MSTLDQYSDEELQWLARIDEKPGIEPPEHIAEALRDHGLILPNQSFPTIVGGTVLRGARMTGRLPQSASDQNDKDEV